MPALRKLVREVEAYYRKEGRSHLPWRATRDPYRILVSEVMLQQTQVDRVIPKYRAFLRAFPTARALAKAPLPKVLAAWQGLGYNRRAKFLQQAAQAIVAQGTFPKDPELIDDLPGVGPYTARAVAAFAFDRSEAFVETNIRTVFFHFLYKDQTFVSRKVDDRELLPLIGAALPLAEKAGLSPRQWYAALMDYGAHLKRSGVRLNGASKHYAKQSKFNGSSRQLRGRILKLLLQKPMAAPTLIYQSGRTAEEVRTELVRLKKEGLVRSRGKTYSIAEQ